MPRRNVPGDAGGRFAGHTKAYRRSLVGLGDESDDDSSFFGAVRVPSRDTTGVLLLTRMRHGSTMDGSSGGEGI